MNSIYKSLLVVLTITLFGCQKQDQQSLLIGKWHLYRYFIEDTDVTIPNCHNTVFFEIKDDGTINVDYNKIQCGQKFLLPQKINYILYDDGRIQFSDDVSTIEYPLVTIDLLTTTELELTRKEPGFNLRYVLNRVK